MYIIYSIEVSSGESCFSSYLWSGSDDATEEECKKLATEYVETFYDDVEREASSDVDDDPFLSNYWAGGSLRYSVDFYKFVPTKEVVIAWLLGISQGG